MSKQLSVINEAKNALQTRAAEVLLQDFKEYRTAVITDGTVDDKRKLVELEMRLTGAEPDKKADPFGNLPVFNFIINRGQDVPAQQAEPMQTVETMPDQPVKRPRGRPRKVQTVMIEDAVEVRELQPIDQLGPERKDLTPLLMELENVLGAEEYTEDDV
jgi:hypothetical protein